MFDLQYTAVMLLPCCETPASEAFGYLNATVHMPTTGGCTSGVLDQRQDSRLGVRSCPPHNPHFPAPSQLSPSHCAETVHCRLPSLPPLCCHVCLPIVPITTQASDGCLHVHQVLLKLTRSLRSLLPVTCTGTCSGATKRLWPISFSYEPCVNVALRIAAAPLNCPNMFVGQ